MCPRALVLALPKMPDDDEKELATLAKRVLAMPPKPRDESKIGKPKTKTTAKANPFEKKRAPPISTS